jgi:hypothetical protein
MRRFIIAGLVVGALFLTGSIVAIGSESPTHDHSATTVASAGVADTLGDFVTDAADLVSPDSAEAHYAHGPNGCHWYQYWGGSWHGPTSAPWGVPAGATVYRSPISGSLYACW